MKGDAYLCSFPVTLAMAVNYDCVSSDHFPLGFTISVNLLPYSETSDQEHVRQSCPKWDSTRPQQLLYENWFAAVPHDALCCTDPNCNDEAHYSHLCKFYEDNTNVLSDAAAQYPLRLITRLRSTLSLVGRMIWSVSPTRPLESSSSSGGLLGVPDMVPCSIL